jgi:hypothetical protein
VTVRDVAFVASSSLPSSTGSLTMAIAATSRTRAQACRSASGQRTSQASAAASAGALCIWDADPEG